jgi:hypothetical protein
MKHLFLILSSFSLLLFNNLTYGQRNNAESIAKAEELLKKFPKTEVYKTYDTKKIVFEVIESKKEPSKIKATLTNESEFLTLKDNSSIQVVEHYNSFTSVNNLKAKYKIFEKKSQYYVDYYVSYEDVAYQSNGIFHGDVRLKSYSINGLVKGSNTLIESTKEFKDYKFLTPVSFHDYYNKDKSEISFTIPSNANVELKELNFEGFDIKKTTTSDPKTKVTTIKYTLTNLRSLDTEYRSVSSDMKFPQIIPIIKSFTNKAGVKTSCFESYKDLYKFCNDLYMEAGNDDTKMKPVAEKITAGKTTEIEKVKAVYYWVQDNIRYIAFEDGIAGFKPDASQLVYEKKYGDCKGMANLMVHLLKLSGIKAQFVWIHTNDSPFKCDIPYIGIFNHAIAVVEINGTKYYIDGTETYGAFNQNAYRISGRPVMIQDGTNYIIDQIPVYDINKNQSHYSNTFKVENNVLIGNGKCILSGDNKNNILREFHYSKSEDKVKYFQNYISSNNRNYDITSCKTTDVENRDIDFSINYDLKYNNAVLIDGNDMFIKLETENYFSNFKLDTNGVVDMSLGMPLNYDFTNTLELPNGYTVKKLPKDLIFKTSYCSISLSYKQEGNKIKYTRSFVFPSGTIPATSIKEWNEFQKTLKKYYNSQIELTK